MVGRGCHWAFGDWVGGSRLASGGVGRHFSNILHKMPAYQVNADMQAVRADPKGTLMTLSPSDRIKLIREIARRLSAEEWPLIDLTLKQFELPWTDQWDNDKESHVMEMVNEAGDESLLALSHHVGYEIDNPNLGVDPPFWQEGRRIGDAAVGLTPP